MSQREIIDLSVACSNTTDGFAITLQQDLPVYLGQECYAYDLAIKSHRGTYYETSSHVFRDGHDTDSVELDQFILPGYCVRITGADPCIDARALDEACCDITAGAGLLVLTGRRNEMYFSRDAAVWMAEHKVALMGADIERYDTGFENPTGFFIELFRTDIPIIAGLANLERLPAKDFRLIVLPLKIAGVCTVPCRAIAIVGSL